MASVSEDMVKRREVIKGRALGVGGNGMWLGFLPWRCVLAGWLAGEGKSL